MTGSLPLFLCLCERDHVFSGNSLQSLAAHLALAAASLGGGMPSSSHNSEAFGLFGPLSCASTFLLNDERHHG